MENKLVFGRWEAVTILINMICLKLFLNLPRFMAESAGTAGWILVVYLCALSFIAFFIILKLYAPFEGKDPIDIAELALGNFGRVITGCIILMFLIFSVSVVLREYGEDMKVISLNISPISYVLLFFLCGTIAAAYAGLEAIARLHALAVPLIASGFLIILIGVAPYYDFTNILPILGSGSNAIFIDGLPKVSIFSELLYLFLIIPFIKSYKDFKSIGYSVFVFCSFFLISGVIVYSIVIPYPSSTQNFLPTYQLARLINYGRFFQRIESFFVLIWATGALLYLATGFYFILYVFKKTFKLEYYKPLIIPFAIIIFTLSLLPPNLVTAIDLDTIYFRNYSWIVTFGMTIFIVLTARLMMNIRKRRKVKS